MRRGLCILALVATIGLGLVGILFFHHSKPMVDIDPGNLGLQPFDASIGEESDLPALCTRAIAVADTHLAEHAAALKPYFDEPRNLLVDHSAVAKIRSLGYKSCFYYQHWSIFVPYAAKSSSAKQHLVLVHVSDATYDMKHDPKHFHVADMFVINTAGEKMPL